MPSASPIQICTLSGKTEGFLPLLSWACFPAGLCSVVFPETVLWLPEDFCGKKQLKESLPFLRFPGIPGESESDPGPPEHCW